jgi:glutamate carboxypeptidase
MLLCHYDTVWPGGEAARRPFRIENDIAYGPGVSDEQHSAAGALTLFELIRELDYDDFAKISLVLNPDEESGSFGSGDLIATQAGKHDVVFSMEDGGENADSVLVSCRGYANIILKVQGVAAHSGENPHDGHNAGIELARQLLNLNDLGNIEKKSDANWTLGSFGAKYNIIPAAASATLNIRTASQAETDRIISTIRRRIKKVTDPGCKVEIEISHSRTPFEANPATDSLARAAIAIFKNELGRELKIGHMGAASDANFACLKAPVLEGMGMGGGHWHALTEFLPLKTIPDRLYLLMRMIQETCLGNTVPVATPDR